MNGHFSISFLLLFLLGVAPYPVNGQRVVAEGDSSISFPEYITRLHQLIQREVQYTRYQLYRLYPIEGVRPLIKDTSFIRSSTGTLTEELKEEREAWIRAKEEYPLAGTSVAKLKTLLEWRISALLWSDSVWLSLRAFADSSFVLVNIPSNTLVYVGQGKREFSLRTVTGKKRSPTHVLSSRISTIIEYPYWNIPYNIAVNEMLPFIRTNPTLIKVLRLEVLAGNKVIEDPYKLPWQDFSKNYFPYRLRQLPGLQNALGIIKFDFPNPYHIYLHDTNNKGAFQQGSRYYSHGCIRVENPVKLAVRLGVQPDTAGLFGNNEKLRPVIFTLKRPISIFIIYATVEMAGDTLKWWPDIYSKIRRTPGREQNPPSAKVIKVEN
ncbi:MAG TPA: L,D-transpeptidase family protein [Chitinophagaceae bacterium]